MGSYRIAIIPNNDHLTVIATDQPPPGGIGSTSFVPGVPLVMARASCAQW
jgi:hypothetical protein